MPIRRFLLGLALLVACGCTSTDDAAPAPTNDPATTTSSLDVFDLDGAQVDPATLVGPDHSTLLVFSTSWCSICRREQPDVQAWAVRHAERARVLYVISGSAVADVQELARERDLDEAFNLTVLADPEGDLAERHDVRATPTLILLAPDGSRVGRWSHIDDVADPVRPPGDPADDNRNPPTPDHEGFWTGHEQPGETATATVIGNRCVFAVEGRELGTSWNATVTTDAHDVLAPQAVGQVIADARQLIRDYEAVLSEWKPDSVVTRINETAGTEPVNLNEYGYLADMLRAALHVSAATGGAFDITWKPLGELWKRAEARQQVPTQDELAQVLPAVSWRHVQISPDRVLRFDHPRTQIGVAGFAKGWIIDQVFEHIRAGGFSDVLVNIGGDLRLSGAGPDGRPHRLRVVDPYHPDSVAACWLEVDQPAAVATSGAYMRYRTIDGERYGHILDPRTGYPPDFDGSVTVLTRDCAMADALATALFVMGPDDGLAFAARTDGVDAVFVTRTGIRSTLSAERLQSGE